MGPTAPRALKILLCTSAINSPQLHTRTLFTVNQCDAVIALSFLSPGWDTGWEPLLVDEMEKPLVGGGGGGGVGARPVGYIEITDEGTQYVGFSALKKMIVAASLGFMAGYLLRGRKLRS